MLTFTKQTFTCVNLETDLVASTASEIHLLANRTFRNALFAWHTHCVLLGIPVKIASWECRTEILSNYMDMLSILES